MLQTVYQHTTNFSAPAPGVLGIQVPQDAKVVVHEFCRVVDCGAIR
jgi:hypothetical protein